MEKIEYIINKNKMKIERNKHVLESGMSSCKDLNVCNEMREEFIEDLEQLKQSLQHDKPIVKSCVAEWYERNNHDLEQAIFDLCIDLYQKDASEYSEFESWAVYGENKPTETLIRMKDGYTVEKEPKVHDIKINPIFLADIVSGIKTFEIRKNDRGYKKGDILNLQEYENGEYTGNEIEVLVTYIPDFPLPNDYVVMGIVPVKEDAK